MIIPCGLDFGTSNSTIGVYNDGQCHLIALENNKPQIRSAIFCDNEIQQLQFGQAGINSYLNGTSGRLLMSLKSVLGSSLMTEKTVVFNKFVSYTSLLSHFIQHLKTTAETAIQSELSNIVMGRPVHFHDDDIIKDRLAQNTLEEIARSVGFKEISFQYEPIAAALSYETTLQNERLALIVDMGGGTSDFTIIHLRPNIHSFDRSQDVLANCGIHIAGTDFDKRLSLHSVMPSLGMGSLMKGSSSDIEVPTTVYHDLTTWHTLNNIYSEPHIQNVKTILTMAYQKHLIERLIHILKRKAGHYILDKVEISKQQLSEHEEIVMDLSFIDNELQTTISQIHFNHIIAEQLQLIVTTIQDTVAAAGINYADISSIFFTGGTTKIPLVRQKIQALFPRAAIIQGDAFGSVGMGLTIEAMRKYGNVT